MWNAQHAPLSAMPLLASSFSIGKVLKVFRINSLLRSDNTPQFFSFAKEEFSEDTRVLQCGKHISGKHCPTSVFLVFPKSHNVLKYFRLYSDCMEAEKIPQVFP
jgi:hypothetical protein